MKMHSALLATTMLLSPLAANADTVTVGYFDPAAGMSGIAVLGTNTGTNPIVQLLGNPVLPTGATGFGFDQILAMVIPPGGNSLSGGLGGPNPTFEFTFNNGFAPPQGGTSYLYATWQGTLTGNPMITLPTVWGTIETPPANPNYTVTTQVLVCNTPNPFCGPFVGGGTVAGQDQFSNDLRIDNTTLSAILPGEPFKITEVFAFTGGTHPPFAQGDVGAVIMTTPINTQVPVPGPIVGAGLPGLLALLFGSGALWRKKLVKWWDDRSKWRRT
jgi:hypothetical protein